MTLHFTVPSAVLNLKIERNEDHSVTVYWQEPAAKGGNDLRYCVIINNDACRFTSNQNYTIYQDEETKRYTVSVKAHTLAGFSNKANISFEIRGKKSGGISLEVGIGVGAGLLAALIIVILVFLLLYIQDRRNRQMIERAAAMNLADIRRSLGVDSCKNEEDGNPAVIANSGYVSLQDIRNQIAVRSDASMNLPDIQGYLDVNSCQEERNASPAVIANRVYEDVQDIRNSRVLENAVAMNPPGDAEPAVIVNKSYEDTKCLQPTRKHNHCYEEVK